MISNSVRSSDGKSGSVYYTNAELRSRLEPLELTWDRYGNWLSFGDSVVLIAGIALNSSGSDVNILPSSLDVIGKDINSVSEIFSRSSSTAGRTLILEDPNTRDVFGMWATVNYFPPEVVSYYMGGTTSIYGNKYSADRTPMTVMFPNHQSSNVALTESSKDDGFTIPGVINATHVMFRRNNPQNADCYSEVLLGTLRDDSRNIWNEKTSNLKSIPGGKNLLQSQGSFRTSDIITNAVVETVQELLGQDDLNREDIIRTLDFSGGFNPFDDVGNLAKKVWFCFINFPTTISIIDDQALICCFLPSGFDLLSEYSKNTPLPVTSEFVNWGFVDLPLTSSSRLYRQLSSIVAYGIMASARSFTKD
jgi:hypothetical protein